MLALGGKDQGFAQEQLLFWKANYVVNFAVNYIATNWIENFAVNYFDGVHGKVDGIVSVDVVLEAAHDVGHLKTIMTKSAL